MGVKLGLSRKGKAQTHGIWAQGAEEKIVPKRDKAVIKDTHTNIALMEIDVEELWTERIRSRADTAQCVSERKFINIIFYYLV